MEAVCPRRSRIRFGMSAAPMRNNEIHVDFVTEPGVLADHHLVTRLTNNNGNFSFAAQVRLDFAATNDQGQPIWEPTDRIYDLNALLAADDAKDVTKVRNSEFDSDRANQYNRRLLPPREI